MFVVGDGWGCRLSFCFFFKCLVLYFALIALQLCAALIRKRFPDLDPLFLMRAHVPYQHLAAARRSGSRSGQRPDTPSRIRTRASPDARDSSKMVYFFVLCVCVVFVVSPVFPKTRTVLSAQVVPLSQSAFSLLRQGACLTQNRSIPSLLLATKVATATSGWLFFCFCQTLLR